MRDCATPRPSPAAAVTANDVNRPTRVAPSAGITATVSASGSSWVIGEASTPTAPAAMLPSTQLTIPSRSGDRPASTAPRSFSAAATIARPKRL